MVLVKEKRKESSVSDPYLWHFETDPDPWIRILDYGLELDPDLGPASALFVICC